MEAMTAEIQPIASEKKQFEHGGRRSACFKIISVAVVPNESIPCHIVFCLTLYFLWIEIMMKKPSQNFAENLY